MLGFRSPALAGLVLFLQSFTSAQNSTHETFTSSVNSTSATSSSGFSPLPRVDLGYEVHQAIGYNETGKLYNFTNIRYAQPPVGNLRFAEPVPPTGRDPAVQDGSVGRICPQSIPDWFTLGEWLKAYIVAGAVESYDYAALNDALQEYLRNTPHFNQTDGRVTEDCLFLDVIVPKAIFDKKSRYPGGRGGAPVVVWIHGGGYVLGSKDIFGNPSGLIKASQTDGSDGIIYVALNYRLGALGWLAGPTFQASGGTANAGLYDQRLAIEWVAKYISRFGGDPKKITLLGESAGGGSITHQITAFGGQRGVSFQRAIPQSPGFDPVGTSFAAENITNHYFSTLRVNSLAEARQKSSAEVILANTIQVSLSFPYGTFTYGPMVDGIIVPALAGNLLNSGRFAKDVSIMVGHNIFESASFTPPYLRTELDFETWLGQQFPGITKPAVDYILKTLYPPAYDGSRQPYKTPLERAFLIVQEVILICNTSYLNKAFNNQTYAYEFLVPPGFHGNDIPYTFYNGQGTNAGAGLYAPVALQVQGYITNFAKYGNPNGPGLPNFPQYGPNAIINGINRDSTTQRRDDAANQRCAWWQKSLYA